MVTLLPLVNSYSISDQIKFPMPLAVFSSQVSPRTVLAENKRKNIEG